MPGKLIIAGGSGSIGRELISHMKDDFNEIVVLSRSPSAVKQNHRMVQWDAETLDDWTAEVEDSTAVINLTGKSIQCRFTAKNKRLLWDSRIKSTEILGKAISNCERPPKVWINASGTSIYPETIAEGWTEETLEVGTGFLAQLSAAWEEATKASPTPLTRKVITRICPVLDSKEGFLPPLIRLSRLGLGGKAGSGKQIISWIHARDLSSAFSFLLNHDELQGIFNLGSPDPRSNADFMRCLREQVNMPFGIPAPAFAIKLGSSVIGIDPSLILDSSYVLPARLQNSGFAFKFSTLEAAIEELL